MFLREGVNSESTKRHRTLLYRRPTQGNWGGGYRVLSPLLILREDMMAQSASLGLGVYMDLLTTLCPALSTWTWHMVGIGKYLFYR